MPAHIDLDGDERPQLIIRRIYNANFLLRLGQQFKFDGTDPEIAARITKMGFSYIAMRRLESPGDVRELNKRYGKLTREIGLFRQTLDKYADLNLVQMMYFSALQLREPPPGGDFPGLTQHEREQSGEPYFRELTRLLKILENAIKEHKRRHAPKRGPRVNSGLEVIALQSAQFFAIDLKGRPFTIDPHKPFKPTAAFDFIKTLVQPLDAVTDDEIVTAIRGAKALPRKRKG